MRFTIYTTMMIIGLLPFYGRANDNVPAIPDFKILLAQKPAYDTDIPEPSEKPQNDRDEEIAVEEPVKVQNFIGQTETIRAKFEDTLLEMGREHNLGYVEMVAANPGVDPWLPGRRTKVNLPKKHLIPHNIDRKGLLINLAEMRMYDFKTDPDNPKTYPLGVGRDGLNTPTGKTKITRKKDGPSWRPTPRMRKADPELPAVVPPGDDNPLGTHALYLGWPQYLIHGTHKPLGVGRRVSSGCIRMYPEDIVKVFENIPVGTQVNVIKQPIKLAWIDDVLYLEAHAEDELADSYEDVGTIKEYRVPETLFADLSNIAGDSKDRLDWKKIRIAVKQRRGIPIPVLLDSVPDEPVDITPEILEKEPVIEKPTRAPRMELNG
jgi:L,D-transpeptidase ErfK/SrfK